MTTYSNYNDFWKKNMVRSYARLLTPPLIAPEKIILPRVSVVHYMPEGIGSAGIEPSHPLIRNVGKHLYIDFLKTLTVVEGSPKELTNSVENLIQQYQRKHRDWQRVKDIEKSLRNTSFHLVANYSLIPKHYRYNRNDMVYYQECANMRATLWATLPRYGSEHYQFIPFYLPTVLPARETIRRYREKFTKHGLEFFHSTEAFDLLDFWRMLTAVIGKHNLKDDDEETTLRIDHPVNHLDPKIVDKVIFAFIESGIVTFVRLADIVEWCQEHPKEIDRVFYKFFDALIEYRNNVAAAVTDGDNGAVLNAENADSEGIEKAGALGGTGNIDTSAFQDNFDEIDDFGDEDDGPRDLFEVKEATETDEEVSAIADFGASVIEQGIRERGELGLLSAAEQRALRNIAGNILNLKDPLTGKTIKELEIKEEDLLVVNEPIAPLDIRLPKEVERSSRLTTFTRKTSTELYHRDIIMALTAPQLGGIIVRKIDVVDNRDAASHTRTYKVQVQPFKGKASTLTFTVPVIKPDGTFLTGGVKSRMELQKNDVPIQKIKPYQVALSSYYGKLFITRNQNMVTNYSRWICRQLATRGIDPDDNSVTNYSPGASKIRGDRLPRCYTAIASGVSSFTSNGINFSFNHIANTKGTVFTDVERKLAVERGLTLCGRELTGAPIAMDFDGGLYSMRPTGQSERLGHFHEVIAEDFGSGPSEYCELGIYSKRIPVIICLCYLFGLDAVLRVTGAEVAVVPTNQKSEHWDGEIYRLKLKDVSYVIRIRTPQQRMLFSGFNAVRKKLSKYTSNDLKRKPAYVSLLSDKGITQSHLRELVAANRMFIDHITLRELQRMGEPTNFRDLLIRADGMLVDDYVPAVEEYRIRGYERVAGMIYNEIVTAVKGHMAKGAGADAELLINPRSVFLKVIGDPSVALIEESNPIHSIKETEAVTYAGWGGRSTVTVTSDTRSFHENDLGIFSESSPDSGKVGIRTFLNVNPNFTDLRGNTRPYDPSIDNPTSLLGTSAAHAPAATSDDPKRVSFTTGQNTHTVECLGYSTQPFRTGQEVMIGYRAGELYVSCAEQDGKVLEVTPDYIAVRYKDGNEKRFMLGIKHGVVSGSTIPHKIVTDMDAGQTFKARTVLCWHSGFFERDLYNPQAVSLKFGRVMNVAFIDTADTDDDGMTIASSEMEALSTPITEVRDIFVDLDTNVYNLVKLGDKVEPDSILCVLEAAITEGYSQSDEEAVKALAQISASTPKADKPGTVTRIEVLYHGSIDAMSASLAAIVKKDNARRGMDANRFDPDLPTTGEVKEIIRVGGTKLMKGKAVIRVYMDRTIGFGTADKFVVGNQLKATVSKVATHPMVAEDGTTVSVEFSYRSTQNRVVEGIMKEGLINAIMMRASRIMATM